MILKQTTHSIVQKHYGNIPLIYSEVLNGSNFHCINFFLNGNQNDTFEFNVNVLQKTLGF